MLTKPQVKYIQSLNEKKYRNEAGVFVAEGPKIINELLAAGTVEPLLLYATSQWLQLNEAVNDQLPSVELYKVTESELEKLSFLSTPNQVLGVFRQPVFAATSGSEDQIILLLDGIQDPGNFGTIVRIADWFGVNRVVAGLDCADVFNPKVVQATMGSIARVAATHEDLATFIREHNSIPVYAASLAGRPLHEFGKMKEGMLLIGNESRGIKEDLIKLAHHRITISGRGHAESLNAAVAAGIILSHVVDFNDER